MTDKCTNRCGGHRADYSKRIERHSVTAMMDANDSSLRKPGFWMLRKVQH